MAETSPLNRDALRAELAEMELRLRIYFDDQLKHKADGASVISLELAMDKLERGDFTDAQARAIDGRVNAILGARGERAWTRRDQVFAGGGALFVGATFFLYLVAALQRWAG